MEIPISVIIGIISIAFAIYVRQRTKRAIRNVNQNKLRIVLDDYISLFEDVAKQWKDVQILYKKKPISKNVYLFKGRLINIGTNDIANNDLIEPFKISIKSDEFKWINFSITEQKGTTKFQVNKLNEKEVEIQWDLFKQEDWIEITSLIEKKSLKRKSLYEFYDDLEYSQKIKNLKEVNNNSIFEKIGREITTKDSKSFLYRIVRISKPATMLAAFFGFIAGITSLFSPDSELGLTGGIITILISCAFFITWLGAGFWIGSIDLEMRKEKLVKKNTEQNNVYLTSLLTSACRYTHVAYNYSLEQALQTL